MILSYIYLEIFIWVRYLKVLLSYKKIDIGE